MTVHTALFELHALQQALQQLMADKITAAELIVQARAMPQLLARLPPRYAQVLEDLLGRLEASALFTEESCSFSQSGLLTHLQGWADKAQETLELSPQATDAQFRSQENA